MYLLFNFRIILLVISDINKQVYLLPPSPAIDWAYFNEGALLYNSCKSYNLKLTTSNVFHFFLYGTFIFLLQPLNGIKYIIFENWEYSTRCMYFLDPSSPHYYYHLATSLLLSVYFALQTVYVYKSHTIIGWNVK